VLDVTNFGTLSRVTEALEEYTFRHSRVEIWVQGCSEQVSLAADTPHNFLATLKVSCFKPHKRRASDQIQPKFNGEKWIFSCSTDLLK
jgi:hypothetical protein